MQYKTSFLYLIKMIYRSLTLLPLLLLLAYMLSAHPFHVGIAEVKYNENQQSIEITLRLFIDDLENALTKRYEMPVDLVADVEQGMYGQLVHDYLKLEFQVQINGSSSKFHLLGYELEDDAIWCYLEVKNVKKVSALHVRNSIFFELFENQIHLVHVDINNKKRSFKTSSRSPGITYEP